MLNELRTMFAPDPFPQARACLDQARADLDTAKARAADGRARSDARALEVKAYPHLAEHTRGGFEWSPSYDDAGEIEVLTAEDVVRAAEVEFDRHEPRIEALRERVRATREQLANAGKNPRIAAIRSHAEGLRDLGVDVPDFAGAAAQKDLGDEFGRIAEDFGMLRAERQRAGLPEAHLFSEERVEYCPPLRNLDVALSLSVIVGLRQAAYAGVLTVEDLHEVCEFLGTKPAPPPWTSGGKGYEIKRRREGWEEAQQRKAQRANNRRLGLGH